MRHGSQGGDHLNGQSQESASASAYAATSPTEDRHPYDEVVWERRDSRITDYRTGAVAFEQLGVEVPSTWSVNATNILAQKYFRARSARRARVLAPPGDRPGR